MFHPVDIAQILATENAGFPVIPLGQNIPEQTFVGRRLNLGKAHLPAACSFRPACALREPQFRLASDTGQSGMGSVEFDGHSLLVLRAGDDPCAPEPYKAKGIKYLGERIRRKAGKAGRVQEYG